MCCDGLASVSAENQRWYVMRLCNVIFVFRASGPPSCWVLLIDKHTTSDELTESQMLKVSVSLIPSCGTLHRQTMFLGAIEVKRSRLCLRRYADAQRKGFAVKQSTGMQLATSTRIAHFLSQSGNDTSDGSVPRLAGVLAPLVLPGAVSCHFGHL